MGGFLVFLASDTTASSSKKQRSGRRSTHKKKKSEATGLVANPGAIATRCETSFPSRAPQRCGGNSTGLTLCFVAPDERFTDGLKVGAGARKVSVLLVLAQVEFRPSWAPPISMPILLPSTAPLPSVLRRIALSSKTSDSGNGVL